MICRMPTSWRCASPSNARKVVKLRSAHWGLILLVMILVLGSTCSRGDGTSVSPSSLKGPYDGLPAWSPDGSQIAFISTVIDTSIHIGSPYVSGIHVMDEDGRNGHQVGGDGMTGVSWSPSGDEMVFSTEQGGIGVMDLEGNNLRYVIANQPGVLGASLYRPSYSPDGTKIVFMNSVAFEDLDYSGSTMAYWQVFVVDVDGTNATKLSPDRVDDCQPAWSRDGTKIAFTFTYDRDVDTDIYVMNCDGSDVVRLRNKSIEERSLSWSPDGTKLAVAGRDSSGNEGIYVLNMVLALSGGCWYDGFSQSLLDQVIGSLEGNS